MADLNFDTSSYPRAAAPRSLMENLKDINSVESQELAIDKQKLDLVNQRFGYLAKGLTSLSADPELNEDKIRKYATDMVKLGYIPNDMAAKFINSLPPTQGMTPAQAAAALKAPLLAAMQQAQTMQEALALHAGTNQDVDQGDRLVTGVRSSPMKGGGFRQTGEFYGQPAVGQTTVNSEGRRGIIGASGPPGFQPPSRGLSGAIERPRTTGPTTPTIERTDLEANPKAPVTPSKGFIPTEPEPLFEEGKKRFDDDQKLSVQKLTAVKPALLAVKLIPDLRSGPGTKMYNEAVAALKANGIIPTKSKDDPTAIYQEVNKYLSQYLKGRGGRSDADLLAAEESSPNPGKQINPALLKLTQTAIAQDRIEAARALHFGDRKDYQNYGRHATSFPALMDERAFSVDTMTTDQKKELAKELKKMTPRQKERFMDSLKVFERAKIGDQ